jgi:hypothetical protein
VTNDELLKRLDEHMARGNELHELNIREHELNRAAYERGMETMLGITDRHERLVEENVRALRQLTARMEAQTAAIFRMLDRLDGKNGPATA